MQIDKTKTIFKNICQNNAEIWDNKLGHFNFSKWYAITYYLKFISFFKSVV